MLDCVLRNEKSENQSDWKQAPFEYFAFLAQKNRKSALACVFGALVLLYYYKRHREEMTEVIKLLKP